MKVKADEFGPRPLQRRWERRVFARAVESEVWMITMLGDLDQQLQGRVMQSIIHKTPCWRRVLSSLSSTSNCLLRSALKASDWTKGDEISSR